jgi:imidazolonepropionase
MARMTAPTLLLTGIGRLFTATPAGTLDDAALLVRDGRIAWVGRSGERPPDDAARDAEEVDAGGALVTPGLVDAHTHPVYAGDRFAEIARRSAGAGYAEIAAMGGGIVATVAATRAASLDDLRAAVRARLAGWLAGGATTVEVKSGYALDRAGELAHVRLLADLADEPDLPRLGVTFLGAHAVPPGYAGGRAAYADEVASWCADAAAAGAEFVDVFCDEGYFTVEETRRICAAGTAAGLVPRLHADELARTGGALLAAEIGAASADHLLRVTADDAAALAAGGVCAVLAPGTALSMGAPPPARALLDAGVTLALGTDHNPGTCGMTSMSLVVGLATTALGLSVDEALTAATAGGAAALRRPERGTVAVGQVADIALWDAPHEGAFAWAYGVAVRRLWRGGVEVTPGERAAVSG